MRSFALRVERMLVGQPLVALPRVPARFWSAFSPFFLRRALAARAGTFKGICDFCHHVISSEIFDRGGTVEYAIIYYCLRSGKMDAAIEAAETYFPVSPVERTGASSLS